MEFGKLQNIEHVDWTLPADQALSLDYIRRPAAPLAGASDPKSAEASRRAVYRLGTPAWGAKEWVGMIYPPKTRANDFLYHYSRSYQCIELNTSHYRIPSAEQTAKWRDQVPPDFLFCSKVFQEISHRPGGLRDKTLLSLWYDYQEALGVNRGPCFLQLPPHFDYTQKALLFDFLKQWPDEFRLALEFRHPSWFQNRQILPALTEYLQSRGIGLVILDVAGRRDLLHTSVSAPFTMVRFIGNDLHPTDTTRMADWAQRLKKWSDLGLQEIFLFVHEPDDVQAPEMTRITLRLLAETGVDLPPLHFYTL